MIHPTREIGIDVEAFARAYPACDRKKKFIAGVLGDDNMVTFSDEACVLPLSMFEDAWSYLWPSRSEGPMRLQDMGRGHLVNAQRLIARGKADIHDVEECTCDTHDALAYNGPCVLHERLARADAWITVMYAEVGRRDRRCART